MKIRMIVKKRFFVSAVRFCLPIFFQINRYKKLCSLQQVQDIIVLEKAF
jgi:hypothetical protein